MRSTTAGLVAAMLLAGTGVMSASAAPFAGAQEPREKAKAFETVQVSRMYWEGDWYCFYWDGWNGPGWYLCDYGFTYGFGWGGHHGWHGWRSPIRPRVRVPHGGHVFKGTPRVRIHRAPPVRTWGGGNAPRKTFGGGGGVYRGPSGGGSFKGPSGGGSGKGISGGGHRRK